MTSFSQVDVRDLDPAVFYGLVRLTETVDDALRAKLKNFDDRLGAFAQELESQTQSLEDACRRLSFETGRVTRRKDGSRMEFDDPEGRDTMGGPGNFLALVLRSGENVRTVADAIRTTAQGLLPGNVILRNRPFTSSVESLDELQHMVAEFQLNLPTLRRFSNAVVDLAHLKPRMLAHLRDIIDNTEAYRRRLQQRHERDGLEIYGSPVATDVAMAVFENIDSHGEIQHGKTPEEISAYSVRRAKALTAGIRTGIAKSFIEDAGAFTEFAHHNMKRLWSLVGGLVEDFEEVLRSAADLMPEMRRIRKITDYEFQNSLAMLEDLDPNHVIHKESTQILTPEERYERNFTGATLQEIVRMLKDQDVGDDAIVGYVLDRKAELHTYYKDVNSFYVCKIGQGNPFLGEAPGALTVVPGTKPTVNLDNIFGSGYADIRAHVEHIEAAAKWHDLFVATSPSKTADKSNVLMVGPQGCGKTEVLRGVGAHENAVGIFAVGSDFNTCWSGEAEKNPKRLFEAAIKIQKESGKHVHILFDEIDDILADDDKAQKKHVSLRLQFQQLMDGVVHYSRVTIWGSTNNIERIPMPMIRRFSKVAIVGELDQADRVQTLRHFVEHMPTRDYTDQAWEAQAKRLEGATGDVIRKVVDYVWRGKVAAFVEESPLEAETLRRWLNRNDTKFSISEYDSEQRAEFNKLLGAHVAITPADIDHSIGTHLSNVAVLSEIESAVATYEGARRFLNAVRESKVLDQQEEESNA